LNGEDIKQILGVLNILSMILNKYNLNAIDKELLIFLDSARCYEKIILTFLIKAQFIEIKNYKAKLTLYFILSVIVFSSILLV